MKIPIDIDNLIGEYALQGVAEMASGFKFYGDFRFQFFYIYGASDRRAEGKFEILDNKLILNGTKAAGQDFKLLQKKSHGKGYTLQINFDNKMFIRNVVCFFFGLNETITKETEQNGIAVADIEKCTRIELIHSYFPDIPTVIDVNDEKCNFFEFTLNPSLEEVVFDKTMLEFIENGFSCSNIYLFGENTARFIKQ